ncbi:tyrosine-type recombinase/integrase [Mesorhizobium qingshengii]|uniref:Tyrosine-type recombinase/integrase n=1 Tax=Mesorhizobium qingshengii TaxID=1165689 RepID=A0ABT4R4L3_9HYPH|nr:tyrosine-type recombinase/integrase [Mesorhizobium qingshengii]MCZ8548689.1 tyrosine-type recombinase/integrase [Mesorhizobium qingshengii]
MPRILLDDAFAKKVDRPATGFVEFTDERIPSWNARVYPDKIVGSLRYKPLGSEKKKRFPLNEHPSITMAEMRRRAEAALGKVRSGADPAAEREAIRTERQKQEKESALDLGGLLDLYYPALAKLKDSWKQDQGYLERDARQQWIKIMPRYITTADCATRLQIVAARAPVAANRLHSALKLFFEWAVDQSHITVSPMLGVKKPTKERKDGEVDRVLSDAELVVLWRAIESARMIPGMRAAFQALALTGKRPDEIAGLSLAELQHLDDPTQAIADFPASRMKARRRHILPLTPPVVRIIKAQIALQEAEAKAEKRPMLDHIFASRFADRSRLARHSLSQCLRRIIPALDPTGEDGEIVKRLQADPPTPKAFRATCATGMARLGIPREDRKAVLAHVEDDIMARHYDAYDRLAEKRIALEAWARHVDGLLSGEKNTGAVIPIRAARG